MGRTILVIDDDNNVREVLVEFLEGLGFTVHQATNGTAVLPLMREHRPDLVLCDVVMPGISGIQVLKQTRMEFPNTSFVMMSGIQEEDTAKEALELGAKDYLTKPVSLDRLEKDVLHRLFGNE